MPGVFQLTSADLDALSPTEAVESLRRLMWAETHRLGLDVADLKVPSEVTAADGGIDAEMEGGQETGLLQAGHNVYQVKTGRYNIHRKAKVRDLFFELASGSKGRQQPERWVLRPRVAACFARGGVFHTVLFGEDGPHPAGDPLILFHTVLQELAPELGPVRLQLWQASQLISLFECYPALLADVARRPPHPGLTRGSLTAQRTMRTPFHADKALRQQIGAAQDAFRQADESVHLRILGEAGIGKTRMALEITGAPDLEGSTLYFRTPAEFRHSPLVNQLCSPSSPLQALLVVDECPDAEARQLWDQVGGLGARVHLITLYNRFGRPASDVRQLRPPHLGADEIEAIFRDYLPPEEDVLRWVPWCGGSPRVAHVIAQNLKRDPQNLLGTPGDVDVWNRFVAGDEPLSSEGVQARLLVLRHVALFERFGFAGRFEEEARAIHALVQAVDPDLSWGRFTHIVRELQERQVLQGETTLHISPQALHVRLWADWWEANARTFDYERFSEAVPPQLLSWFHEMLRYVDASPLARGVTGKLLSPGGPVDWPTLLARGEGQEFFVALTEADPEAALGVLEGVIQAATDTELHGWRGARRTFVRALEMTAVWAPLFTRSATLLLRLAAAENESWGNNASGVFAGLFSLSYGTLGPTEAPPSGRFGVLDAALDAREREQMQALRGLGSALQTQQGRVGSPEYQGSRPTPGLWQPRTWEELFSAYRWAWERLTRVVREQPSLRMPAFQMLLEAGRMLLPVANLSEQVTLTVESLAESITGEERDQLFTATRDWLRWNDDLDPPLRERLQRLNGALLGGEYADRLRRWTQLTQREDFGPDEDGEPPLTRELRALAEEGSAHPERLEPHLLTLSSGGAGNAYYFGYQLAVSDPEERWLAPLLDVLLSATKPSSLLLAGYLRGIFDRLPERAEQLLDLWSETATTRTWVKELTFRTQLTVRGAARLLHLIGERHLQPEALAAFEGDPLLPRLPRALFRRWLEILAQDAHPAAIGAALAMLLHYPVRGRGPSRPPVSLTTQLLIRGLTVFTQANAQPGEYTWNKLAESLAEASPAAHLRLARHLLTRCGSDVWRGSQRRSLEAVLSRAAQRYPQELWPYVTRHLERSSDISYYVRQWLRGNTHTFGRPASPGALPLFRQEDLWRWVDGNSPERAVRLAGIVHPSFDAAEGLNSLARELLNRYGGQAGVRTQLAANFGTEGWTGPASLHLSGKRSALEDVLKKAREPQVRQWLTWYIGILQQQQGQEVQQEERGFG